MDMFFKYFIAFMIYSILGWCMEVILTFVQEKKFVDRGFLLGPYCPIYGYGMLLIVFLLKNYMDSPLVLFVLAMVICMILEYLTSYFMELIFKARWWDYSKKKFNINGRVCLEYAIPFGVGGTLIMYLVHPFIMGMIGKLSIMAVIIIGSILFMIFIVDNAISFNAVGMIKGIDFKECMDNTEEITKIVRDYLVNKSKLTKRLVKAFPNAAYIFKKKKSKK